MIVIREQTVVIFRYMLEYSDIKYYYFNLSITEIFIQTRNSQKPSETFYAAIFGLVQGGTACLQATRQANVLLHVAQRTEKLQNNNLQSLSINIGFNVWGFEQLYDLDLCFYAYVMLSITELRELLTFILNKGRVRWSISFYNYTHTFIYTVSEF